MLSGGRLALTWTGSVNTKRFEVYARSCTSAQSRLYCYSRFSFQALPDQPFEWNGNGNYEQQTNTLRLKHFASASLLLVLFALFDRFFDKPAAEHA